MSAEEQILGSCRVIAVVGLSPKEDRPSYTVARYLQKKGYRIIPVNPQADMILGEKCYRDLYAIPEKVDLVNIFRRSEEVMDVIRDSIAIGAGAVWMQEGIRNEEAAKLAREAGLVVVMDRCLKKVHQKLFGAGER